MKFAISIGGRILKFLFPVFSFSLKVNIILFLPMTETIVTFRLEMSQKKEGPSRQSLQVTIDKASCRILIPSFHALRLERLGLSRRPRRRRRRGTACIF